MTDAVLRQPPKVLVVGAGIGGLSLALSLHKAGIPVEVLEAVTTIRPLGVGINLLPHAVRELSELGLAKRLDAIAIRTRELIYTNKFGQEIWREDRGLDAGYRWPQYSIHRGRLQMLLFDAVRERLGTHAVATDTELVALEQDAHGVTAQLRRRSDGSPLPARRAAIAVGADGIHSVVRASFYPAEGPPKWNGAVLWRAVSEAPPYLTGRSMIMAGHQDQKFVCYPIGPEEAARGSSLVNWIAELRFAIDTPWKREDWNRAGRIEDFLPKFEPWDFGWLDVPGLIRAAKAIYEFPMVDRDPVAHWTFGRITLLGDAAHSMYPIGSNGASQAIIDGRVLAWRLATESEPQAALRAYEADRLPAMAKLVLANRANGPERVMQFVEQRAPRGYVKLDDIISRAELEESAKDYKLVAGFDKDLLADRSSFDARHPLG